MNRFIKILGSTACLAILAAQPALAKDAPTLIIENFIGTIDVRTGNYDEITITDADGAHVQQRKDVTRIDDGVEINHAHCKSTNLSVNISIGKAKFLKHKGGYKNLDEYPKITITAPQNTHLVIEKSVIFGDVETIGSADVHVRSCGDLILDDINGDLDLNVSGSGDVDMGNAGASTIHVSGSGDVTTGNLQSADIHISGSGDLEIDDVAGHVEIHSSGSSDIEIGDINGGLDYQGSGSSDVEIDSVSGGDIHVRTSGSGDVLIDGGNIQTLRVQASGASDVVYKGRSVDATAHASGASDVTIRRPSGDLRMSDSGAGDVHIRN